MTYLEKLFKRVAEEINKKYEDVLPFLKMYFDPLSLVQLRLEENWYDTEQAISGIKDEQYDSMKIPKRISSKIKEILGRTDAPPAPLIPEKVPAFMSPLKEQTRVSDKPTRPYQDVFVNFRQSIKAETTGSKQRMLDCINLLERIISTIIQFPNQQKYRHIKVNNSQYANNIERYHSAQYLIEFLGFQKRIGEIYMQVPELDHLDKCRALLTIIKQDVEDMFDPYKAGYNSSNTMPSAVTIAENEGSDVTKYNQLLDELIAFRKKKMSMAPANRQSRIYHKRYEVKDAAAKEVVFEQQLATSSDPMLKKYWAEIMANNSAGFKSKRRIEFEALMRQPVFETTLIKIRFPNEYVLEGLFAPLQKIKDVFEYVKSFVNGDVYIYTAPPVVQMSKHMEKTLFDMECVPSGVFYMSSNSPWSLKNQYAGFVQN